jgi:ABC-2 type transport system permease protein
VNARRVGAVALRQYYLIRGSVSRVLPLFAWVAIDMVLWGFITRYLNAVSRSGLDFVPRMLGAVLLWDFTARVMQGVTMAFLEDVWSRNFLNLFASPVTVPEYVAGLVLTSVATSAVGLAVMLALSTAAFGLPFGSLGLAIVPFVLILFLSGIALGIACCAVVLRFGPAAEWFVWPVPALLAPFAGVFYPVATLPGWMQAVSKAIAPSYVFESARGLIGGGALPAGELLAGGALSAAYVLLAAVVFARVCRRALRTGLIARYSAESVA